MVRGDNHLRCVAMMVDNIALCHAYKNFKQDPSVFYALLGTDKVLGWPPNHPPIHMRTRKVTFLFNQHKKPPEYSEASSSGISTVSYWECTVA